MGALIFTLLNSGLQFFNLEFRLQGAIVVKFLTLLKCSRKWKPCLVSCGHILETCTNFGGLFFVQV